MPTSLRQRVRPAAAALLALLLSACGGLAGEPQIVATLPVATPTTLVLQPPDLSRGAALYAQHCTACHGLDGAGQGELVLNGQVPAMPSFLDDAHVGAKLPDDYYQIVTAGNLERLMPPWRDTLTEQERRDVSLYVYSLRYTAAQQEEGRSLYALECARCHGPDGRGDGEEMVASGRGAFDMTDLSQMLYLSDESMLTTLREGVGETMPAYADDLSTAQMRAVIAYVRGFSRAQPAAPAPESTEAARPASVSIRGRVTNGTTGGTVPPRLTVYLRYGNQAAGLQTLETTLQP
ncbi:MAG: cytochrome c, partial [Anaerolineae bacterium]|nr:cytochrome c [Anaerolineae bacterium]